jgi:acyl carrier protein
MSIAQQIMKMMHDLDYLPADFTPDRDLRFDDVGMDPSDCADLFIAVEQHYEIALMDSDIDAISSVGHLATAVERELKKKEAEPH